MNSLLKIFFLVIVLLQSCMVYGQSVRYLNEMEYPVVDLSKYPFAYIEITIEKTGVIQTQLVNRDTVKIQHSTALVDEKGKKTSERILRYFPNGNMKFNKRIDFIEDKSEEKYYYENGDLKIEISREKGKVVSEVFYTKSGEVISSPKNEDPSPKGGVKGWNGYLVKNLRYPNEAQELSAEGTVILVFNLDEKGQISNVRVANPEFVHESLWKEGIRVVEEYPNLWNAKIENGEPVPTEVKLPIRFKLG